MLITFMLMVTSLDYEHEKRGVMILLPIADLPPLDYGEIIAVSERRTELEEFLSSFFQIEQVRSLSFLSFAQIYISGLDEQSKRALHEQLREILDDYQDDRELLEYWRELGVSNLEEEVNLRDTIEDFMLMTDERTPTDLNYSIVVDSTEEMTELEMFASFFGQDWPLLFPDFYSGARMYIKQLNQSRRQILRAELIRILEEEQNNNNLRRRWISRGAEGWDPNIEDVRQALSDFVNMLD